jgi:membrane protein DedA with SNARE-associated domain
MLESILQHGSMALVFFALLAGGLGLPVSEDLILLAAGALWHRGLAPWQEVIPICFLGVFLADSFLFTIARRLGPPALKRRFFKRLLAGRQAYIQKLFKQRGGGLVFLARYSGPFRAAVYIMAGVNGMAFSRFALWDALALCLSVPLVTSLGYFFSEHLDPVLKGMATTRHYTVLAVGVAALAYWGWRVRRRSQKPKN